MGGKFIYENFSGLFRSISSKCLCENKADSYNDLIQNLYKRVEQMQSIWQGVDHLAFQNQLEEFRPSLNEMYQVILEYSNVLKQTASVYEKLQQDRVQQAKLLL